MTILAITRARLATTAVLLCALAGCSSPDAQPPGADAKFPADPMLVVTSDTGRVRIEVRAAPDQPPSRGSIAVEYRISDATTDAPEEGIGLDVLPWMTAMGHGTSVMPTVTPKGDGLYVLTNVDLFMPGRWELRSTLSGPVSDHATPEFQIP